MFSKFSIVAKYTLKELLKSKIIYVSGFIAFLLIVLTFTATEFTYGVPEKVSLEVGLGLLSLSSLGISLFMGIRLLPQEIESRTVYMVISRPASRVSFITGKIFGVVAVLCINILILSFTTLMINLLLGGEIAPLFFTCVFFNLLEAILLLLVVVLFSLVMNATLAGGSAFLVLLLGHAVKQTQNLIYTENREVFQLALKFYHFVLPAFHKLNFKDFIVYERAIPISTQLAALGYGICYSLAVYLLIIYLFNKKNLD